MKLYGVSYLAGVGDTRYSPVETFYNLLIENGCIVSLHDPYVTFWEEVEAEVNQDLYNLDKDVDIIIFST